jgi:cyclopropane fatty-acyl-phospholipid synthase-like methyltransferase
VGNAVTYVEWPSKQRDFARWRFARRGLDINLADDLNNGMKDYDAIISTDVIEHIHPDEYDKVAQSFARVLKPDGEVKALARWTAIGEDCPMHFNEPDKWEAAMKRAGFRGGPVSWRKISE